MERVRASKSLVDDEANLSNWVDDLRTGRATAAEPARPALGLDREEGRFGSRRNGSRGGSTLGKRRDGDDLRKGKPNLNVKRKFQLSSDDDDEVVGGGKFKGGGGSIGKFLSEEEEEEEAAEEESGDDDEEEIVNKSRSALFGKPKGLPTSTPRPSPAGSDSYLSDTRLLRLENSYARSTSSIMFSGKMTMRREITSIDSLGMNRLSRNASISAAPQMIANQRVQVQ